MRKVLFGAMAIASFGLSGCVQPQNLAAFEAEVQADTQKICSFVPTAETIINLLNSGGPGVGLAETLANAICNTVGQKPKAAALRFAARRAVPPPTLYGVRIKGRFK